MTINKGTLIEKVGSSVRLDRASGTTVHAVRAIGHADDTSITFLEATGTQDYHYVDDTLISDCQAINQTQFAALSTPIRGMRISGCIHYENDNSADANEDNRFLYHAGGVVEGLVIERNAHYGAGQNIPIRSNGWAAACSMVVNDNTFTGPTAGQWPVSISGTIHGEIVMRNAESNTVTDNAAWLAHRPPLGKDYYE